MSRPASVLAIEDEKATADLLVDTLHDEADVITAFDGCTGLQMAQSRDPDLIILDLKLPAMHGLEVCRRLRAEGRTARIPVLILSAEAAEADRVVGLELGADDYVTKPFSPRELKARVRALLRRSRSSAEVPEVLCCGPLKIDVARRMISYDEQLISFTATEFRVLLLLAQHPGRVMSRDQIGQAARDGEMAACERTIDAHIKSIRRKLGAGAMLIETVHGFGYRLRERSSPAMPAQMQDALAVRDSQTM